MLAVVVIGSDVSLLVQNPSTADQLHCPLFLGVGCPIQRELLRNLTKPYGLVSHNCRRSYVLPSPGLPLSLHALAHHPGGEFSRSERHIGRNNLTTARPVELATPVSFSNLRPLELGYGSSDLVHELRKRNRPPPRPPGKSSSLRNRSNSSRIKACQHKLPVPVDPYNRSVKLESLTFRQIAHSVQGPGDPAGRRYTLRR